MTCWIWGDTLDKKFSLVSCSTLATETRKLFHPLPLTLASLGIITAIVLVFASIPCIPNPCLSRTTITFQFFAGTAIFSFLPMLPFLPTGPATIWSSLPGVAPTRDSNLPNHSTNLDWAQALEASCWSSGRCCCYRFRCGYDRHSRAMCPWS